MTAAPTTVRKSTSRLEHRERMVEDIVAAARTVVTERGVSGLSMRTLGRQVGVTAATLYGYFDSREAVLDELLHRHLQGMTATMMAAVEGLAPGAARLFGFAIGYRQFARETPDFFQMFIYKREPVSWDDAIGHDGRENPDALGYLHDEIETAIRQGEMYPIDPVRACLTLWSIVHGYVSLELNNCFATTGLSEDDHLVTYMRYVQVTSAALFVQEAIAPIASEFGLTPLRQEVGAGG